MIQDPARRPIDVPIAGELPRFAVLREGDRELPLDLVEAGDELAAPRVDELEEP